MNYDIPKEYKPFMATVKRMCSKHGIELMLAPSKTVVITDSFSTDCSGYFDDTDKVLAVACGKPFEQWIEILVHEYGHMQQWIHDERWEKWGRSCGELWSWIDKEMIMNNSQLKGVIDNMIELERDCEIRALEVIKKYNLPINKAEYKRKANLYLYSYRLMPILKKFPTGIYDNRQLVAMCPPRMLKKYDKVPEPLQDLILKLYS